MRRIIEYSYGIEPYEYYLDTEEIINFSEEKEGDAEEDTHTPSLIYHHSSGHDS
jgi:hypothetical protein